MATKFATRTLVPTAAVDIETKIAAINSEVDIVGTPTTSFQGGKIRTLEATATDNRATVDVGASDGGTFTLTVDGQETAAMDWDDTPAAIKADLELLSTVDLATVTGDGSPGDPYLIQVHDQLAAVAAITGDGGSLVSGSLTVVESSSIVAAQASMLAAAVAVGLVQLVGYNDVTG